jgi:surface protein
LDVTDWDLSLTTNIQWLFAWSKVRKIVWLNTWDTRNITDMSQMFQEVINVTGLELNSFDTRNV